MYYVYQVRNIINDKKYIGSTKSTERRWKEHLGSARQSASLSYNYPLQKAIRKYGEDCFEFSILYEDQNPKKIAEKEKEFIKQKNTLTNSGWGYNQTLFTDCALRDPAIIKKNIEKTSRECCLLNNKGEIEEIFGSLHEAGDVLGLDPSFIKQSCDGKIKAANNFILRYYEKGQVIHLKPSRGAHLRVCGISVYDENDILIFKSVTEASKITGASRSSIAKCIAGNSKYSRVQDRIWRKIDLFNEIIENNIEIKSRMKRG